MVFIHQILQLFPVRPYSLSLLQISHFMYMQNTSWILKVSRSTLSYLLLTFLIHSNLCIPSLLRKARILVGYEQKPVFIMTIYISYGY